MSWKVTPNPRVIPAIKAQLNEDARLVAKEAARVIRREARVDTGEMRDGIYYRKISTGKWAVGGKAPHTEIIESRYPWIEPAIRRLVSTMTKKIAARHRSKF